MSAASPSTHDEPPQPPQLAPPGPDLAMASFSACAGVSGMILNGFVLFIALRNEELRKRDFIMCVLNRTLLDFAYSICLAIFQPLGILAPHMFPNACQVAGFQDVAMACGSAAAEPIIAGNRYVSICHRDLYTTIFRSRLVQLLICASVWIVGVGSAVPHAFYGSLGRVTGVLCAVQFNMDTLLVTVVSNYSIVCLSLTLVAYFNFSIYRRFKQHQSQVLNTIQRTKLQKQKDVAKFIFVSAIVPLSLQMPATIGLFVRMYRVDLAPDWAMFGVTAVFASCTVVNPVITLFMVKPLRREWRNMLGMETKTVMIAPARTGNGKEAGDSHY